MVKPSKKLKKMFLILGVTGAVYVSFQYLLPLVTPFLAAYAAALALKPSSVWLSKKIKILPVGVAGGIQLFFILTVLGIGIYWGGVRLFQEAVLLAEQIPVGIRTLDLWLTKQCRSLEAIFQMQPGRMVMAAREVLSGLMDFWKGNTMPFLMINSMTVLHIMIQISVFTVIFFVAAILSLQEMESLKERREHSMFRHEFALLGSRILKTGQAYFKVQGSILLLTMGICIAGLFFMKNPYYILLGMGIGLLDMLPVFGTGTVFIPWILISFLAGDWKQGVTLAVIYAVCYLLRQILEAKLMADQVGLTPWETLISMFVGLKLFGFLGFLLGPLGLLIIEDLVEAYDLPGEELLP